MVALAVERDPMGFLPVSVATIVPSKVVGVPLFIRDENCPLPRLYRGSDYPLAESDLNELLLRGVTTLHIRSIHYHRYQEYIRRSLPDLLADPSIPPARRFEALDQVARDVLHEVFRSKSVDQAVDQAERMGKHVVSLMTSDDFVASHLLRVIYHDYHTFTHSVNVAYFAVALARGLGIVNESELERLAAGALLHDVGKLQIPEAVLSKPGRLNDDEYEQIQTHPTLGFSTLCERENLSFEQLMMVYQHHERLDGHGYPVGVVGEEIHLWGRLCAVADIFEALTSNRPYRPAMSLEQALSTMQRQAGTGVDEEILACWIGTIRSGSLN
ncbi:MAG TPA: HD-GYP domain-containing protein [Planctomycetaceae bacterium]|nr:HD-GYP domain-containing protein [Planctomycetaceae bacterium]